MRDFGYIKIFRKLKNKGFYKKSKYIHLWLHLILKANYEEKEIMWNGKIIKLKPGQFITGRLQLSQETGIKSSTTRDILRFFEKQHQIRQQTTNKFTIVTIVNWHQYQIKPDNKTDNKGSNPQQPPDTAYKDKNFTKKKEKIIFELNDWNRRQSSPVPSFVAANIVNKHGPEKIERLIKKYGSYTTGGFGAFLNALKRNEA